MSEAERARLLELLDAFDDYSTRQSVKGAARAFLELQRQVGLVRDLVTATAPVESNGEG